MNPINRRTFLGFLSAAAAISLTKGSIGGRNDNNKPFNKEVDRLLTDFLGEGSSRPGYVWFNREDLIYHDQNFPPEIESHPDFWIFTRERIWVFNRAMEWLRNPQHGTIINYCSSSELMLTGEKQISSWHTSPPNALEHSGELTHFKKRSRWQRDCAVLPAFQFHIDQNPVLELDVTEADSEWQFCVSIKGRGGPPVFSSDWKNGPGKISVDLKKILKDRGYDFQFAELHFAIGVWSPAPAKDAQLKFRLGMASRDAIITNLPVVRTMHRAEIEGAPFEAIAISGNGQLLGSEKVKLTATVAGKIFPLTEKDGIWKTLLRDLPIGDHEVIVTSEGQLNIITKSVVRVTDGRFFKYDKESGWVTKDGKITGPLSGSFQGTFYFRDAGLPGERMIQGQKEWDEWDRSKAPGEHMSYWEALTPHELDERFAYLSSQGFDLLALHSHWGLWERLDAGGRIAPHAAEQLALYLRTAGRYGLAHIQALSSGPYGIPDKGSGYGDTVPYSRYLEEGFQAGNWFTPGSRFDELFYQYISDFISLFRDETALFGITASGEGDSRATERANDIFYHFRNLDPDHIILAESIDTLKMLPEKVCAPYPQDMLGGRTYRISENEIFPEFDLGLEFKLYRTVSNIYMAEGSWPPMPGYTRFHREVLRDPGYGSRICWTGTPMYRIRLRDTLYLGLINRMAVMNTWDEMMTEDEHLLIKKIRDQVDWTQSFPEPEIGILADDACAGTKNPARLNLAKYEEAFSRMPLSYRLYTSPKPPSGTLVNIDGRKPFTEPTFHSAGGYLPEEIKSRMPLVITENYCASYIWSEDRFTLLSYFYNVASHYKEYQGLGGNYHRSPQPVNFDLRVQNFPALKLHYQLYDLNEQKICREIVSRKSPNWNIGITDHDYFLLVTPV